MSASELIDCPDLYDGQRLSFVGEVVEAVFPLGERSVVTLNDDDYALGAGPLPETRTALGGNSGLAVVLPIGFAPEIDIRGDFEHRGDRVHVTGTYQSASELLGGEPAIDATTAQVVADGYEIDHPITPRLAIAAAASTLIGLTALVLDRRGRGP